jgi:tetratricopeptide (TPR) repeat protein
LESGLRDRTKFQSHFDPIISLRRKKIEGQSMNSSENNRLRDLLVKKYESKDFAGAEELISQLKKSGDSSPDLDYSLGLVHHQTGRVKEAVEFLSKAHQRDSKNFIYAWALAEASKESGQFERAIEAYRDALHLEEKNFDLHLNLATLLHRLDRREDALVHFIRCTEIDTTNALAFSNLGAAWQAIQQFERAEGAYRKSIELNPQLPQAWNNLGNLFHLLRREAEAEVAYREALKLNPKYVEAIANLGDLLQTSGKLEEAESLYRRARENGDRSPELCYNEGNLYLKRDEYDRAIACYDEAIGINPQIPQPYANRGVAHLASGDVRKAMASYQKAIAIKPDFVDAHWNRSLAWLVTGNYEQGWPEHEWRWKLKKYYRRKFPQPMWEGESFAGKRLLIFVEQGLGDTLHFVRYIPMVKALGGTVILETQPPLESLMKVAPGVDEVVLQNATLPEFDLQVPIVCLPRIFKTKVETIPATVPYLVRHPVAEPLVYDSSKRPRIGIVWAGSPIHDNDRNRSCPLETLMPLFEERKWNWVSFQKGPSTEKLKSLPESASVENWGDRFRDFVDTAWALDEIDLLITVDTSVAHLAGAFGKKVWLMIPFNPDWRWMLEREDSPWYPTFRIFRQDKTRRWETVVEQMKKALQEFHP